MSLATTENGVSRGNADVGINCRNNQSYSNAAGGASFGCVAKSDSDVNSSRSTCRRRTDRQHHADLPLSTFTVDAESVSAASHLVRSASESDLDVQSTSSSLYVNYAESPGSMRRRRRQSLDQQRDDEYADQRSPSRQQLNRDDNVDDAQRNGGRGGDGSPRAAARHRRRAPAQHVSSSFENLVGGLLAVPQSQRGRYLASSNTTYTVSNNSNADSLCGRGDDILPALTAFLTTGTPTIATRGSRFFLPVDATSDPEPVLPRSTKHAPQHVRRAKHLFKSCQSCVRRRSDNDAKT